MSIKTKLKEIFECVDHAQCTSYYNFYIWHNKNSEKKKDGRNFFFQNQGVNTIPSRPSSLSGENKLRVKWKPSCFSVQKHKFWKNVYCLSWFCDVVKSNEKYSPLLLWSRIYRTGLGIKHKKSVFSGRTNKLQPTPPPSGSFILSFLFLS